MCRSIGMIQQHRAGAVFVEDKIRGAVNDVEALARWRLVQKRIAAIMEAAAKDARAE